MDANVSQRVQGSPEELAKLAALADEVIARYDAKYSNPRTDRQSLSWIKAPKPKVRTTK